MDAEGFWALIDRSRSGLALTDPEEAVEDQLDALQTALRPLSDRDLLRFQERLHEQTARANDWHIWAAGYLAAGGMSDDAFDYFRLWLVLQGQAAFERVLAEPDELAALRWDLGGAAFNAAEVAGYLVAELLEERGSDPGDALVTASATGELSGRPFDEEDDDWFTATLPKLAARVVELDALDQLDPPGDRPATADVPPLPPTSGRPEPPGPVAPLRPALAAELYERGHIQPQDRPMLAAYWLADDLGGEAVLELASLRGHEPEVSDLWPKALAELGVPLPVSTPRAMMPWAAQRVVDSDRDARWLVRTLWMEFREADAQDDFERLILVLDDLVDWADRSLRSRKPEERADAETARASLDAAVESMARDDLPGALRALGLQPAP